MRCLTLADSLEAAGWRSAFVCAPGSEETVPALAAKRRFAPGAEPREPVALAVFDHYGLDARDERAARATAERILVIDDLANRRHDCDFLLDQTIGRAPMDYSGRVPEACRFLLGCEYALLREEFLAMRARARARRDARPATRILLSFGASDPDGYGVSVSAALLLDADVPFLDLVSGAACLEAARALKDRHPGRIAVHFQIDDMARLMTDADLAIGAAGTTSWERCALGLPAVAMATAANQRLIAARLSQAGAVDLISDDPAPAPNAIAARARALAADGERLSAMARAAAGLVDGRGALRVLLALAPSQRTASGTEVRLRAMEANDVAIVFRWQHQEGQRRYSRDPSPPDWEGHIAWFDKRVCDQDWKLLVISENGMERGLLQLNRLASGRHEVSILVDTRAQRRGLGVAALRAARVAFPGVEFEAEIAAANVASLATFTKAGFVRDGSRYAWRVGVG